MSPPVPMKELLRCLLLRLLQPCLIAIIQPWGCPGIGPIELLADARIIRVAAPPPRSFDEEYAFDSGSSMLE